MLAALSSKFQCVAFSLSLSLAISGLGNSVRQIVIVLKPQVVQVVLCVW